jgi:hypothetical protein
MPLGWGKMLLDESSQIKPAISGAGSLGSIVRNFWFSGIFGLLVDVRGRFGWKKPIIWAKVGQTIQKMAFLRVFTPKNPAAAATGWQDLRIKTTKFGFCLPLFMAT